MARRSQAIPELDVLDGRAAESAGIESPDLVEHRAPDGAAPCPERRGLDVASLMDEVMEKVPVSRDQATAARPRVVGAEDGRVLGMIGEEALDPLDRARREDDVGIHEQQDGAARATGALVPGRRRSRVLRQRDDGHAHAGRDGGRSVRRTVVDDDDLAISRGRGPERVEAETQITGIVVDGNDD
jgi:hypothetical protein